MSPVPHCILLVCLGNICRSPIAEAAVRAAALKAQTPVKVDSAGTAGYHIGKRADPRSIAAAAAAGLDVTSIARQVQVRDFHDFDLIVAMDAANAADLRKLAPDAPARDRIMLFGDIGGGRGEDVPDPYYGTAEDFDDVVRICTDGAQRLIMELRSSR